MSSDSAHPQAGCKAIVTLTVRNPRVNFVLPQRQITLTEQTPSVRVGRASKVASKGFIAGADNAWFDSPVMSREHAELIANFEAKSLSLRDTNSLHGTFRRPRNELVDARLEKGEKVSLEDGDEIRFGIDIYRSHETFPPCVVDLGVKWNSMDQTTTTQPARSCSTNRFVVPDDEDEDWQTDEDKSVMEIDKPGPKLITHSSKVSIDLTGTPCPQISGAHDASPVPSGVTTSRIVTSDAIDLTSEPSEGHGMDPHDFPDYSSDDASDSDDADADDDDDDDDDTSDDDEGNYSPSSPELTSPPPVTEEEALAASYRLSSIEHQTHEEDSEMEDEHGCCFGHDSESHVDGHSDYPNESSDNESVAHSCSSPCVEMEDAIATDDFDCQDNFGGDDNDYMGNEPEYNGGSVCVNEIEIVQSQPGEPEKPNSITQFEESLALPGALNIQPHPNQVAYNDPIEASSAPISSEPSTKFSLLPLVEYELLEPPSTSACGNRLPSPSDAALPKSHLTPPKTPAVSSMAQSLGERTGKYDFFAAREQNRATVMANTFITIGKTNPVSTEPATKAAETAIQTEPSITAAAASEAGSAASGVAPQERAETRFASDDQDNELWLPHVTMDAPFLIPTAWTSSGEAFLKEPHHCPVPSLWDGHLERDMTSAATYVESKRRSESKANQTMRRVRIQELLAQDPSEEKSVQARISHTPPRTISLAGATTLPTPQTPARPAKRAFSDVFPESEAELSRPSPEVTAPAQETSPVHAAESEVPSVAASGAGECASPQTEVGGSTASISGTGPASAATPIPQSDVRPAKRRRFAQIAACAFGGIMGGAAVLAGMIATAPIESVMNGV